MQEEKYEINRTGQEEASAFLPARLGTYYETEVPDTLDLAYNS